MTLSSREGSLLPFELVESILSRVPTQSLIRFKLVCKRWLELLKEKRFIHNNFDMVHAHYIKINPNMVEIINPITKARSCLPLPDEFYARIYHVIHCDGLLLCTFRSDDRHILKSELAVWNPCFNQVRWISAPLRKLYRNYDFYGFGYDNVSRDNYKMLRLGDDDMSDSQSIINSVIEIYEFKSNSWRTLDVPFDWDIYFMSFNSVCMKGNMYWIAKTKHVHYFSINIQCFDFSTEKFKYMCDIPFEYFQEKSFYDVIALSNCREDKLLMIHQRATEDHLYGKIEVWITNSVDDKILKFTKLFALSRVVLSNLVGQSCDGRLVYFMDKNGKLNVLCREEELTNGIKHDTLNLYSIEKDGFREKLEQDSFKCDCYMYFPSLVPVP